MHRKSMRNKIDGSGLRRFLVVALVRRIDVRAFDTLQPDKDPARLK